MLSPPSTGATASSSASSISSLASSSVNSSTSDVPGGETTSSPQAPSNASSSATASPGVLKSTPSQQTRTLPVTAASSTPSKARSTSRSSSKRKVGGASGTASSSHVLRTTSTASAVAASHSSMGSSGGGAALAGGSSIHSMNSMNSGPPSPRSINSVHSGASSIMIAPPPRVALGSSNQSTSVGPESSGVANTSGGGSASVNAASGPPGGSGSGNTAGSGSAGSSTGNSIKDAQPHHFVYTANHHNHHQRHHGHHSGNHHHSISSVSSVTSSSVAAAAAASLNASAASAQLVREKDMRIAQLERELKIMETEFTRELDKLSKAESETATFWQAKHNRLQQQVAHSDTAFQLLRAEVELREAERTELRAGWEDMQRAALDREEEMRALRNQVRGLKEWVSTSTRTDGQVASDEVFGDGMARLANGLQNWVIVHFRRAKLDLDKAGKTARDDLAKLVPMYEDLMHSSKLHMLQSAVSRIFVELVFESYYVGLPSDQASQLMEVEAFLKKFAGTAEAINQWRSLTLAIVSKDAGQQLQEHTAKLTESVVARVNGLLDAITADSAAKNEARDQALRQLVTSAVDLARLLVAQKAMFRVNMPSVVPHQQVFYDSATMEDIGGGGDDDDDGLAQREISCVVFPGIIKRGDETGSQLQYTNVIFKARVLCVAE